MNRRVRCQYCDKRVKLENIEQSYEYKCPRCGSLVYRPGTSRFMATTLSLSSLLILFWAVTSPLLNVEIIGNIKLSLLDTFLVSMKEHFFIVSFLILITLVIPTVMSIITLIIVYSKEFKLSLSGIKKLVGFYLFIKEWNMIEVYFLGLLIALVKLYQISTVELLYGFWFNLIYVVILYISLIIFNPLDFVHIKLRSHLKKNSLVKTSIFLFLAIVFIFPANLVPMMTTYKFSVVYDNTIMDGINSFINDGEVFVPLIIFLASICLPILKILSLLFLQLVVYFNLFVNHRRFLTKYYHVMDKIGKYSLLDVFVVIIGFSYIQFENAVSSDIGNGMIPFCFVVIFTMLASKNFDTKLLWRKTKS
jgi:paraquat-inducible protein A